jgi:uncharacterized protein
MHAALRCLLSLGKKSESPSLASLLRKTPAQLTALFAGDPAQAFPWVLEAARHGVTEAQLRLGRMYLEGTGVAKNQEAAFRWFSTAARDHNIEAMNMLGRCHENGWGTEPDPAQAAICYQKAATRGDAWAQYNLGHMFLDGNGVQQDADAAFHWYSRAAAQNHPRAMNLLARCHEEGWGTPHNPRAARALYRKSAEAGYFRGEYNYATLLLAEGDARAAETWLRRAAAHAPPAFRENIEKQQAARLLYPAAQGQEGGKVLFEKRTKNFC